MNSPTEEKVQFKPFEILLNQDKIAARIKELGRQIAEDYAGETPVMLGVLKGCVVFLSDLMRQIELPMELEFVSAASYQKGRKRSDEIIFGSPVPIPLKGRHVLIVEGVVDTGRTVTTIRRKLAKLEPATMEVVTLVDKPASHRVEVDIKYRGFSVGNEFVIGFGLDNTQRYRNLPFIGRMIDK